MGQRYPAIVRLWENAWAEFIPFLDYDLEIRQMLCSTDEMSTLPPRWGVVVGLSPRQLPDLGVLRCQHSTTSLRAVATTATGPGPPASCGL
jgi:hypothetical protein